MNIVCEYCNIEMDVIYEDSEYYYLSCSGCSTQVRIRKEEGSKAEEYWWEIK